MIIFVGIVAVLIAGWSLVSGMRTAQMAAMGVPHGTFSRDDQPVGFWLAAVFNSLVLASGTLLVLMEFAG